MSGLTRQEQKLDTIYVLPDGQAFVSPDGEGRYWYNDLTEARREHGFLSVVYLTENPED